MKRTISIALVLIFFFIFPTSYAAASSPVPTEQKSTEVPNLEILLKYPELGEYGQYYTFNENVEKATAEDKNTVIQCFIPAGRYSVKNEGKYPAFIFIYSKETKLNSFGWEEPIDCWASSMLQSGDTCEITINEGYYIKLFQNNVFRLKQIEAFFSPTGTVSADTIDLSGMTYNELVALKDQINLAIWNSQEWQEVTVPIGVWIVGEDIPAGHWTIKTDASYASISICDALDALGKNGDIWNSDIYEFESISSPNGMFFDPTTDKTEIDFVLKKGMYVIIDGGNVIFSPYAGKPNLGFK